MATRGVRGHILGILYSPAFLFFILMLALFVRSLEPTPEPIYDMNEIPAQVSR